MENKLDIINLNIMEKELYDYLLMVLQSKKYQKISADKIQIIFGRIYSSFVINQLLDENKIIMVK